MSHICDIPWSRQLWYASLTTFIVNIFWIRFHWIKFKPEFKYLGVKWRLSSKWLTNLVLHIKSSLSKLISFRASSFHFPIWLDRMPLNPHHLLCFNHCLKARHFLCPIFCATYHCANFNFWCFLIPNKIHNSFIYLIYKTSGTYKSDDPSVICSGTPIKRKNPAVSNIHCSTMYTTADYDVTDVMPTKWHHFIWSFYCLLHFRSHLRGKKSLILAYKSSGRYH